MKGVVVDKKGLELGESRVKKQLMVGMLEVVLARVRDTEISIVIQTYIYFMC